MADINISETAKKAIDAALKRKIARLADEFFAARNGEEVNITALNTDVFVPNNINYKEYMPAGTGMLKKFLGLFPETFLLIEKNINGNIQYFCSQKKPNKNKIKQILIDIVKKAGGKALLAKIRPTLLDDYGIDTKIVSGGLNLLPWLKSEYGKCFVFDDNYISLANGIDTAEYSSPDDTASKAEDTSQQDSEITQMHDISFMSWWSNNAKTLQKYTARTRTSDEWRSDVAHAFARAVAGSTPLYIYTADTGKKILFDTQLKTANGNSIYCVLKANPDNEAGDRQAYAMDQFCCIAEEENELTDELKRYIPEILRSENQLEIKYNELKSDLDLLLQSRDTLMGLMPSFSENISNGVATDDGFFGALKLYRDKWNHAKDIIEYLGWDSENEEEINLGMLKQRLERSNRKADIFKKAVERFVSFAEAMLVYLNNNFLEEMAGDVSRDIDFIKNSDIEANQEIKNRLDYYIRLMDISDSDDSSEADIEYLREHFASFSKPIFMLCFYKKTAEAFGVDSKSAPSEIMTLLSSIDSFVETDNKEEDNEPIVVDTSKLLNDAIAFYESSNADVLAEIFESIKGIAASKLEKAIIAGDYRKCKSLIASGMTASIDKTADELIKAVEALESNGDAAMSLYDCGKRLYDTVGNNDEHAEQYIIAGLISDPDRSSRLLLEIYIEKNEPDLFYTVWEKFARNITLSAEQSKYLIYALAFKGEDVLREYLDKHVCLFYVNEYSDALHEALKEFNYSEILSIYKNIRSKINPIPQNELEKQILDASNKADFEGIIENIQSSSLLAELEYTDEEASILINSLNFYATAEEQITPIERLYEIQRNKNSTVEKQIWNLLFRQYDNRNCLILLKIMCDEHRYDELCKLYECYIESLSEQAAARELYMIGLLNTASEKLSECLCANLQDCMSIYSSGRINAELLENTAEEFLTSGDESTALLCKKVLDLCAYLSDSIIKSIVLISDGLRETAVNTEKLVEFGLDSDRIESFVSRYKTDSFSRKYDVLGIAERLYSFIGIEKGAAEAFATLAIENGYNATRLLWKIYSDTNNIGAKLLLITEHPQIRTGREEEYRDILFGMGEYERFLRESENADESDLLFARRIIAKCNIGESIDFELEKLQNIAETLSVDLMAEIAEAMITNQYDEQYRRFIVNHFDELISLYANNIIDRIITANGKASEDDIKKLQKQALSEDLQTAAIYIYENFGIGRMKGASKDFFNERFEKKYDNNEDRALALKILKTIYAKNEDFSNDLVLKNVSEALSSPSSDVKTVCRNIERAIEGAVLSARGFSELLEILKPCDLPLTPNTMMSIIKHCRDGESETAILDYFGNAKYCEGEEYTEVLSTLCSMYTAALKDGSFKLDWKENAERVCARLVETEFSDSAAYCAFIIQKLYGERNYAKFILWLLLEKKNKLSDEISQKIEVEAKSLGLDGETTLLDLFVEMAKPASIDAITEYCEFCGTFLDGKEALISHYNELEDNVEDSYTDEDFIAVLKLLYCDSHEGKYWNWCATNLPLEDAPEIYAKLFYKAALLTNKDSVWKRCISACELYSTEGLLSNVLLDCARNAALPYGLKNLRSILAEKGDSNPMYFSQLPEEVLVELVDIMCTRTNSDPSSKGLHDAVRDIAAIAIASDSKKAYSMMMSHNGEYIFNGSSSIGIAIASRLLLRKRFEEAKTILQTLSNTRCKYSGLVKKLSAMSADELSSWASIDYNEELLNIILPDGNYPDIHSINSIALSYMSEEKAEAGAMIISSLLDEQPHDYACYSALFLLCKLLPHRLDLLHKALCGLTCYEPSGSAKSYYSRSRKDNAIALATLNVIICAQGKQEEISEFDGYDFRESAKDYYQRFGDSNVRNLDDIQNAQSSIERALMNQSEEGVKIISAMIFGRITGNWCEFLTLCYNSNTNAGSYLDYYEDINLGLARSILKVTYSMNEQKNEFIKWVQKRIPSNDKNSLRDMQAKIACEIFHNDYYSQIPHDLFEIDILDMPFEESQVFVSCFNRAVIQVISKDPVSTMPCAMLAISMAHSDSAMSELWHAAMTAFEQSRDYIAYSLFYVLHKVCRSLKIYHGKHAYHGKTAHGKRDDESLNLYRTGEKYEALMRVSGAFAGNDDIASYICDPEFNAWSCVNMLMALIYTQRANEVERLKHFFAPENQQLADTLLLVINKSVSDREKIEAVKALENENARGVLCFIMAKGFTSANVSDEILEIQRVIVEDCKNKNFRNADARDKYSPTHFIWLETQRIHETATKQIENFIEPEKPENKIFEQFNEKPEAQFGERITLAAEATTPLYELSILKDIEPVAQADASIEDLWKEHESFFSLDSENCRRKLELTKRIYQIALYENTSNKLLNSYAIKYGVDYYYDCIINKKYEAARDLILELVNSYDPASNAESANILKNLVRTRGLNELLHRGYSSIRPMAEAYMNNKQAFIKMRNMLPESKMHAEIEDVNTIYAALESITNCLKESAANDTAALKMVLSKARSRLNKTSPFGWAEIRQSISLMIRDEINKLDQRPIISYEILSKTASGPTGHIHGSIKNIGNVVAENITVQIEYNNGFSGNPYVLSRLGKDDIAIFEIYYTSESGTRSLDYGILITYESKGEEYCISNTHTLTIDEQSAVDFPTGLYLTDRPISDFVLAENGTVYSENFFGREEEKKRIESLFNGKSFAEYKNVIITGIRRAGKTSMLNYLVAYANFKCDDAIAIFTTCEGIKANEAPIQRVLIDSVINESKMRNVGEKTEEEWDRFKKKWTSREKSEDFNPEDLQYFYRELKTMNGEKGLMLVIDEFDILIETVESNSGVYNSLLPSLRVLLNNVYCQDAIHLAICGSNKLIRYMDGGTLNQLFQQFGDNKIEIGRLSDRDMKEMLLSPYREYPDVKITPEALNWIWKYTNGLVWYSKLVTNCALARASSKEHKRNTVYPADIANAVTTVTGNDEYFKSLITSCTPAEQKVIGAIQAITSKATEYVTVTKIMELLSHEFTQKDVETLVNTLERMQILQRNTYDKYSYRFAVELYWHYFRVLPSNYKRCEETPVVFTEKKTQHNNTIAHDDDY